MPQLLASQPYVFKICAVSLPAIWFAGGAVGAANFSLERALTVTGDDAD